LGTFDSNQQLTKAKANNIALPINTPIKAWPMSKPTIDKGILKSNAE